MAKGSISIRAGSGSYALSWQSGYGGMSSGGYAISKPAASSYANAAMKMKGYSFKPRMYGPVSLFPVSYGRLPDPLDEARRLYKKKCPSCGNESRGFGSYGFN